MRINFIRMLKNKSIITLLIVWLFSSPISAVNINFHGFVAQSGLIVKGKSDSNSISLGISSNYRQGLLLTVDIYNKNGLKSHSTFKHNFGPWSIDVENKNSQMETFRVTIAEIE